MARTLNRNQTFKTPDKALAHYGTKGMKWGVRKERTSSPREKGYSVDGDGRITISKGHELQRVFESKKSGDGSEGANYFSFTERDKNTYVMMMGAGIDSRFKILRKLASDKVSTMVAKEELRSPSREEAFDILKDTMSEAGTTKGVRPFSKDFSDPEALAWYQDANTRIVLDKGSDLHQAYFSNLRSKGYNILLDEMDAGFLSDLPIIVLDGANSLRPMTVRDLQGQDVKTARALIKQEGNRSVRQLEDYR